ncbi:unnamed protein product [Nesidiocoris tenuis]|uniref:C1q domain-containing protein n=1 Tax=Nesidiocoris tenuis TaxID=355587 RepID=A0A6H5GM59_9HEMI|nr:unnamed protein product [Nesidiocoris tenuis]
MFELVHISVPYFETHCVGVKKSRAICRKMNSIFFWLLLLVHSLRVPSAFLMLSLSICRHRQSCNSTTQFRLGRLLQGRQSQRDANGAHQGRGSKAKGVVNWQKPSDPRPEHLRAMARIRPLILHNIRKEVAKYISLLRDSNLAPPAEGEVMPVNSKQMPNIVRDQDWIVKPDSRLVLFTHLPPRNGMLMTNLSVNILCLHVIPKSLAGMCILGWTSGTPKQETSSQSLEQGENSKFLLRLALQSSSKETLICNLSIRIQLYPTSKLMNTEGHANLQLLASRSVEWKWSRMLGLLVLTAACGWSLAANPEPPRGVIGQKKLATAVDCSGPVGFTAVGNLKVHQSGLIAYKNALVDHGVGLSRETGEFTVHCPGIYHIAFTAYGIRIILKIQTRLAGFEQCILASDPPAERLLQIVEAERSSKDTKFIAECRIPLLY